MEHDFEVIIKEKLIQFMVDNNLVSSTVSDGCGNRAVIKKNKHGFFKVQITNESTERTGLDV